ncbi:MAG: efflux RND transporter periplasmic adaptor subunit [Burkholderiales bacterium]|nr:MAG: efflux RND transporter periplasmic adaptor subunit [Burkholderiales bacterium]RPH65044.1 MAG: efflux RND transporter periplasmic adaptor subunit [Burkholderiales bacterium]
MRVRLLMAGLLPAILLVGCEKPAPAAHESLRPVRSVVVEASRSTLALTLPAEVRPRVETRYGFRLGGKIAARLVSVGDAVKPGQELARLDPQDLAPALAAARSQLDAARTESQLSRLELDRLRELRQRDYVSQAQLDRAQAAADAADARRRSAEAQLTQASNSVAFQTLRADVAGVVTAIDAEAGQVVSAGQSVVRVARGGEVELEVDVPEGDLALARATRTWRVTIPALGRDERSAQLRELSPVSDPASRTFPMRLALQGDTAGIGLGMTAVVQALRDSRPAFVLPMSALYSLDGRPHVWRIEADDTVRPVVVVTDGFLDDTVRIAEGLSAGDRIVTAGANLLVAGQKVRVLAQGAGGSGR